MVYAAYIATVTIFIVIILDIIFSHFIGGFIISYQSTEMIFPEERQSHQERDCQFASSRGPFSSLYCKLQSGSRGGRHGRHLTARNSEGLVRASQLQAEAVPVHVDQLQESALALKEEVSERNRSALRLAAQ